MYKIQCDIELPMIKPFKIKFIHTINVCYFTVGI